MRWLSGTLIVFLVLLVAWIGRLNWQADAVEYQMYEAVVEVLRPPSGSLRFPTLVYGRTVAPAPEFLLGEAGATCFQQADLPPGIFRRFARRNLVSLPIRDRFSDEGFIELVRGHLRGGPSKLVFSNASFVGGDSALVYVELTPCGLCGFGRYYYLERDAQGWKVVDGCEVWVS